MAEYIEREALIEDLDAAAKHGGMGAIIAQTLQRYVMRAPAADVAPVVKCEKCRRHHWHQEPCHGKTVHTCDMLDAEVPRDFFCAFAERKDGAT